MKLTALEGMHHRWSEELGCSRADLDTPGTKVVVHQIPGYSGAQLLRRGDTCIVSVPEAWLESVTSQVASRTPDQVFLPEFLATAFGEQVERIIGPAYLGCVDESTFAPVDGRGTRLLEPDGSVALTALSSACSPTAWDHSGIRVGEPLTFGCYVADQLAAAGNLKPLLNGHLLHVGIVTHPEYRGCGYGKAVVSAMTAHAIGLGSVLQYRTLLANLPAVGIAHALGYRPFATTLAVRLRSAPIH